MVFKGSSDAETREAETIVGIERIKRSKETEALEIRVAEEATRFTREQEASRQRVELDDADVAIEEPSTNLIALDEALTKLAKEDPVVADLVKLRYFAGLTLSQIAEIIGISRRTADRYWAYARAWLYQEITKED